MNTRSRAAIARTEVDAVSFTLDGRAVSGRSDESILQIAQSHGVQIPHLCWTQGLAPAGNCRACMVEIQGERVLAASCCRKPAQGMQVSSTSGRARQAQKMVLELLRADLPEQTLTCLLYTSPSPRDRTRSRMPSSA